jgi:hypothetical protein
VPVTFPSRLQRTRATTETIESPVANGPKARAQIAPLGPPSRGGLARHFAAELNAMSREGRSELEKIFALFAHDKNTCAALKEVLDDPRHWPVPMRVADEQRVLALAIDATPLPDLAARRGPTSFAIVRAQTNGTTPVPDAFDRVAAAYARGDEVTIAPEWMFVPPNGVAWSEADKDALVARLCALTVGQTRLLVPGTIPWADERGGYHNTAFAIAGGEVVHQIDKRGDGDDADIAKGAGLAFVHDDGGTAFEWNGLRVSLEVCRDHGDARTRRALVDKHAVVDLQLVVSSGVCLRHAAVGVGGACVVAQGDECFTAELAVRTSAGLTYRELPAGDTARVTIA